MVVKELEDVKGFGVVKFDEEGDISSFVEKPDKSNGKFVNTGMYMIEKNFCKTFQVANLIFQEIFFRLCLTK